MDLRKSLMASACALLFAYSGQGQSTNVYLGAKELWKDTGIAVTNGESVTINADSLWTIDLWSYPDTGPDGFDETGFPSGNLFFANNIHGSLIAYVGTNGWLNTNGVWTNGITNVMSFPTNATSGYWEIGTTRQFVSDKDGELYLLFNDDGASRDGSDNSGSVMAQVYTGYGKTNDFECVQPVITNGLLSGQTFSFTVNGPTNTYWAVYDSSDLVNWQLMWTNALVMLGTNGTATVSSVAGTPYRFYKVCNGHCSSRAYGFVQIPVGPATFFTNGSVLPGTNSMIADQLENSPNTLDSLFSNGMPDGTFLPYGTQIWKLSGSAMQTYTWLSSSWSSGGGSQTLLPGEGAFLINATNHPVTVTFVGLVPDGPLSTTMNYSTNVGPWRNFAFVSSKVPQAGGVMSLLNLSMYDGDELSQWNGSFYKISVRDSDPLDTPTGWMDRSVHVLPEPIVRVGESLLLDDVGSGVNLQTWSRTFWPRFTQ